MKYIKNHPCECSSIKSRDLESIGLDIESENFIIQELNKIGILDEKESKNNIETVKEIFYYELYDINYNGSYAPIFKEGENYLKILIPYHLPMEYDSLVEELIDQSKNYMVESENKTFDYPYDSVYYNGNGFGFYNAIEFKSKDYYKKYKMRNDGEKTENIIEIISSKVIYKSEKIQDFIFNIKNYLRNKDILLSTSYSIASTDKFYSIYLEFKKFKFKKIDEGLFSKKLNKNKFIVKLKKL